MKNRGENYSKIKIKKETENELGFPEKDSINGEELVLLEKDFVLSDGASESGIGKVATIRDSIENTHSSILFDHELYCQLSSSISCQDFIVAPISVDSYCSLIDTDNSHACLINWDTKYYTIQDIYNLQSQPYIPNGSELVLLGGINKTNQNGTDTGATTLSELIENSNINTPVKLDINNNLLSLAKNNRLVDISIIDRIGRDAWIITLNSTLTTIDRFDEYLMEYTNIRESDWDYFYFTTSLTEDPNPKEKYCKKHFNGSNIFKIREIKSSDQVYLWLTTKSKLNIPVLTFKISDFFTGNEPSSYNNLENECFFILNGDLNSNFSIEISGTMSWMDRDLKISKIESSINFPTSFSVCDVNNNFKSINFFCRKIMLLNPLVHQINKNDGCAYGNFSEIETALDIESYSGKILKDIPIYSNEVYLVIYGDLGDNTQSGFLIYPLKNGVNERELDDNYISFTAENTVYIKIEL